MTSERSARALSIRARELSRHLRLAQGQSGLNGKTLANRLGWSETRLSRVLSGRASSADLEVSAFLGICGVTGKQRNAILRLCRPNADADILRLLADDHWDAYLAHAGEASSIFEYQPGAVPWMAQAPAYTQAVLSVWPPELHNSTDQQVTNRCAAASLLSRPGLNLLLHEWALRNPVGAAEVMSDQLHHLLRLSVRSTLSIRVIPIDAVAAPAAAGGFALLEFPDYDAFVYREEPTAGLFVGDARDVESYRSLLAVMYSAALDEAASRDLLTAIAREFGEATGRSDDASAYTPTEPQPL